MTASVIVKEREVRRLARVSIIPAHVGASAGEVVFPTAVAYDEAGQQIPDARFLWSMKDPAAGSISSQGVFRAGQSVGTFPDAVSVTTSQTTPEGPVQISATATVSVTRVVTLRDVDRVVVLPEEVEVEKGGLVRLIAQAVDRDGVFIPGVTMRWTIIDERAGSVDSNGLFIAGSQEGLFPGAIGVESEGVRPVSGLVSIRVTGQPLAPRLVSVTLLPQGVALEPADTFAFGIVALDQRGNSLHDVEVMWSLVNPQAGALDARGSLRAGTEAGTYVGAIRATVTRRQDGETATLTSSATVTILEMGKDLRTPGTLATLALSPREVSLAPGSSSQLSLVGLDVNGRVLRDIKIQWAAPEGVATMTPRGRITAVGRPGVYPDAIKVRAEQQTERGVLEQNAVATLIITGTLARAVVLPQQVTVEPGGRVQYSAAAYDENGVRLLNVGVRWSVLDPRAGTIDRSGLFRAGGQVGEFPNVIQAEVRERAF